MLKRLISGHTLRRIELQAGMMLFRILLLASSVLVLMPASAASANDRIRPASEHAGSGTESSAGVQFSADFGGATGAILTTIDGVEEQRAGELRGMYKLFASVPPGQAEHLVLRVVEDNTAGGPDGEPGVLRLENLSIPAAAEYAGFTLYGIEDTGVLQIPAWNTGAVTEADLGKIFIEFRFRAANADDAGRFGGVYGFRFEPMIGNSYSSRADFGVLVATSRWRRFRRPIGSADNLEQFLKSVNAASLPQFKLVWGHHGPIQSYAAGDCLLIDDVRIVAE
jgi:hypothetical protein